MSNDLLWELLGTPPLAEGEQRFIAGRNYVLSAGMLRELAFYSPDQAQTRDVFGYKWNKRETFEGDAFRAAGRAWLNERYGEVAQYFPDRPAILLDAGCGAGHTALELYPEPLLRAHRYLGVDISNAVDVAAQRFQERGLPGTFMQADITALPFPPGSVDIVYSEGVLHHTDSTRRALENLARLLRPGGHFLFYVYKKKGPIREFTDDYIREKLQPMAPEEAWKALEGLTLLGKALSETGVEIDVPLDIPLLEIPAGRIPLQRFFYWHIFKAFYRPEMSVEEMLHINFDWYAPKNALRQTPEEVRDWCEGCGLDIVRERVENSGITVVARKRS